MTRAYNSTQDDYNRVTCAYEITQDDYNRVTRAYEMTQDDYNRVTRAYEMTQDGIWMSHLSMKVIEVTINLHEDTQHMCISYIKQ